MAEKNAAAPDAEAIAREHQAVRRAGELLERELELLERQGPYALAEGELPEMVRALERHLLRHFRHEERGGLLGPAGASNPGVQRELEHLRAQHVDLSRRLRSLTEGLAGDRPVPVTRFASDLRRLLLDLAEHEGAEDDLFQRVYGRDLGTVD